MFEKRPTLNKKINYAFVIRSSFFHPFDEANLKLSFFVDHTSETFIGYYHLAIDETEKVKLNKKRKKLKRKAARLNSTANSKSILKKIALA